MNEWEAAVAAQKAAQTKGGATAGIMALLVMRFPWKSGGLTTLAAIAGKIGWSIHTGG